MCRLDFRDVEGLENEGRACGAIRPFACYLPALQVLEQKGSLVVLLAEVFSMKNKHRLIKSTSC